jgi:hypothetical protein
VLWYGLLKSSFRPVGFVTNETDGHVAYAEPSGQRGSRRRAVRVGHNPDNTNHNPIRIKGHSNVGYVIYNMTRKERSGGLSFYVQESRQ